jgi:hypothetical protein
VVHPLDDVTRSFNEFLVDSTEENLRAFVNVCKIQLPALSKVVQKKKKIFSMDGDEHSGYYGTFDQRYLAEMHHLQKQYRHQESKASSN